MVGVDGVGGHFRFSFLFFVFSLFYFLRASSLLSLFFSILSHAPRTSANNCNLLPIWEFSLLTRLHVQNFPMKILTKENLMGAELLPLQLPGLSLP